ncbi:hypothetical protein CKAN_00076100 [Cinnamomum micranthum f. kanehirae]|uniref:Uncharacterized protein n=1 Tax=Cinnamomum micranthum f. kanehirae TaxID=337451 RepID=A0A443N1Z5_9MAGN|nr:hypothetical protein CKAN_00076100 [Cinnamomum micranthum f. kanehirae]
MDVVGLGVTHLKTSGSFIGNANQNSSEFCTRTTTNGHGASITCYSTKKSRDHSTSLASHSVSLHGLADRNGILRKSHLFEPVINRNPAGQTYCSVGTCTVGQSLVEVPSMPHMRKSVGYCC